MRSDDSGKSFSYLMVFALLSLLPATARAQASSGQREPVTVEKIESGFAVAPDFRFTEVDGEFSQLTGAYGGWLMEERLLIGGGAYWLTASSGDVEMSYGGAVLEWFASPHRRLGLSLRGLVGGGSGTLALDVPRFRLGGFESSLFPFRGPEGLREEHFGPIRRRAAVREGFFVAEPQATAILKLTDWLRLGVGGGYRLIAGARGLEDRLRGASASVSVQLGSF